MLYVPPGTEKKPQSGFMCEKCVTFFGRKTVITEIEETAQDGS